MAVDSLVTKLCAECERVFNGAQVLGNIKDTSSHQEHHQSLLNLEKSAKDGCFFCIFLDGILSENERAELFAKQAHIPGSGKATDPKPVEDESNPLATKYSIESMGGNYKVSYTFKGNHSDPDKHTIQKRFTLSPAPKKPTISSEACKTPELDLSSSTSLASRWLEECKEKHPKCRDNMPDSKFVPTRLIDLGEPCSSVEPRLYIHDSKQTSPVSSYMTLSHCWGTKESAENIPRLLQENLKERMARIVVSELPKTFQDAIAITQKLGVRYLWIDSLCIIQNSDGGSDWLKESALMGDVYANSYCNIAATAAKDGTVGCFSQRNPIQISPLKIETSWSGLTPGTYNVIDDNMWRREVDDAPLNQRAWVFQERFLTARNLSFGANRLFWECQQLRACETFPDGLPPSIFSNGFKVSDPSALEKKYTGNSRTKAEIAKYEAVRAWLRLVTGAEMPPLQGGSFADGSKAGNYRLWIELISHYSKGALTYESDRLIALYGVAKWYQKLLFDNDEYLAGHWRKHLVNQLMWTTYKNMKKSRPAVYRAPSWSWASVDGKLAFRDILEADEHTKLAQLVKAEVTTNSEKTGQITGGYIRIRGKLVQAAWKLASPTKDQLKQSAKRNQDSSAKPLESTPSNDSGSDKAISYRSSDLDWAENPSEMFQFTSDAKPNGWNILAHPDVEDDGFRRGDTFCLALQLRESPPYSEGENSFLSTVEGLVLQNAGKGGENYKRIGWFVAYNDGVQNFKGLSNGLEDRDIDII